MARQTLCDLFESSGREYLWTKAKHFNEELLDEDTKLQLQVVAIIGMAPQLRNDASDSAEDAAILESRAGIGEETSYHKAANSIGHGGECCIILVRIV